MKRQSSFKVPSSEVSRNIDNSTYDNVKTVASNIDAVDRISASISLLQDVYNMNTEVATLVDNLTTIRAVRDNETNINDSVNVTVPLLLSRMNITNMIYTNGNLTKIEYEGTNNYEDFSYDSEGNLAKINHTKAGVLAGTTTFSYDEDDNLISSVFTEA